jgi:hypothetical protein
MSKWFLIVISLIILSSIIVVLLRIESRKENERIEKGDLSADDFEIIE